MLKNNLYVDLMRFAVPDGLNAKKLAKLVHTIPGNITHLHYAKGMTPWFVHLMEKLGYDIVVSYVRRDDVKDILAEIANSNAEKNKAAVELLEGL